MRDTGVVRLFAGKAQKPTATLQALLTLRLRHAWGEPKDWPLEDKTDEAIARQALERLGEFAVDDLDVDDELPVFLPGVRRARVRRGQRW